MAGGCSWGVDVQDPGFLISPGRHRVTEAGVIFEGITDFTETCKRH